jgi:hypothetical protein
VWKTSEKYAEPGWPERLAFIPAVPGEFCVYHLGWPRPSSEFYPIGAFYKALLERFFGDQVSSIDTCPREVPKPKQDKRLAGNCLLENRPTGAKWVDRQLQVILLSSKYSSV